VIRRKVDPALGVKGGKGMGFRKSQEKKKAMNNKKQLARPKGIVQSVVTAKKKGKIGPCSTDKFRAKKM